MDEVETDVNALREALAAATRRAEQAEQTLEAIYAGAAGSIVVPARGGGQVSLREGADRPFWQIVWRIVELMAQGVAVCDAEGRVLRANHALADLLGRPASEIVGRPISELVAQESRVDLEAVVAAARAGKDRPENGVLRLIGRGGIPLPVFVGVSSLDLDGIDGFLATVTDLSHQARDDELLASDRLTRSLIDQVVDAIVVCDPDGRVIRASREAHRLCGSNPLLRRFDEAFPLSCTAPGDVAPGPAGDLGAPGGPPLPLGQLLGDEPIRNLEVTLTFGSRRDVLLLSCGPIRDEAGRRLAQVVVLTDVTPLKQAEARLLEADRRKDEFLAMLAHELRNPLAAMAYAVALLRGDEGGEVDGQIVPILERQVAHMRWLVDDLLDVARVEKGRIVLRPGTVDLAEMAEQATRVVRPAIDERGHTLILDIAPRPLWLHADPIRVEQILVNLLSNAAKYTPPGGRIALEAGPDPGHEGRVRVAVRDNGVGLTAEIRDRVFDLFAQADRSLDRQEGGLGIGLTLVRRLVELHGGTVEVASEGPGRGSTFTVFLPSAAPPETADQPAGGREIAQGGGRHVLLVDDNRDMARALARLLEADGHRVDLAHDGPSGLEAADRLRPEVAVLDIGLPGLDGYELARRLRASATMAGRRLIAVSGYGGRRDRERAFASGFDHHLTKPVDLADLDRLIREAPAVPTGSRAIGEAEADAGPSSLPDPADHHRGVVPPPATPAPTGAPTPTERPPAYRILLVEDQLALATVARRVLERIGHVVEVARDGPSALAAARRFRPDVILCDLQLDGPMDGHDVARALRLQPELADAPLIAVTAREGEAARRRSLDSGFDLHLTKPVDFTEVHRFVEQARRR